MLLGGQTRPTELMLNSGSVVCTELPSWRVTEPQTVLNVGPVETRIGTVPTNVSALTAKGFEQPETNPYAFQQTL